MIAMGNPDTFLRELFEFDFCEFCGGDHQHHVALPFLGNWFARCCFPPNEDGSYHDTIKQFRSEAT